MSPPSLPLFCTSPRTPILAFGNTLSLVLMAFSLQISIMILALPMVLPLYFTHYHSPLKISVRLFFCKCILCLLELSLLLKSCLLQSTFRFQILKNRYFWQKRLRFSCSSSSVLCQRKMVLLSLFLNSTPIPNTEHTYTVHSRSGIGWVSTHKVFTFELAFAMNVHNKAQG